MAGKRSGGRKVGVLALQGDVALHMQALSPFDVDVTAVKSPRQLKDLYGLIIPGGESTALLRLCEPIGMLEAMSDFAKAGGAIFGTCAGAILLAKEVTDPIQKSLGLIDITIRRNGFGRQIDSMETRGKGTAALSSRSIPLTFIRAPRITAVGPGTEVLAAYDGEPVLVRQKNILAATFHPELQTDRKVYGYWLGMVTGAEYV